MKRTLAGALALLYSLNGIYMLVDPAGWFARVPGVVDTGPYNPHLVLDVGLAFLATGAALGAFAWRPRLWPAALAGSVFPALHAVFHLVEMAGGHSQHIAFDLSVVVLPAALAVAVAWPTKSARGG